MGLIIIYKTFGKDKRKLHKVLSCVVYTLIENYVCTDYLTCQSKTLCDNSNNPKFKETRFNLLLSTGIPELLLNLVSCHGFMLKSNSTVILNFWSRLINNYFSKGFFIIDRGSKQLNLIPNDVRLRINLVDQLKIYYVMVKNESLSVVADTIKQLHIHTNMNMTYKQDFYKTKQSEIDVLFWNALFPSLNILNIMLWSKNGYRTLMWMLMKKCTQRWKVTINEEENWF